MKLAILAIMATCAFGQESATPSNPAEPKPPVISDRDALAYWRLEASIQAAQSKLTALKAQKDAQVTAMQKTCGTFALTLSKEKELVCVKP